MPPASTWPTDGALGDPAGGALIGTGIRISTRSPSSLAMASSTVRSAGDSIRLGGSIRLRSMGMDMGDMGTDTVADPTGTGPRPPTVISAMTTTTGDLVRIMLEVPITPTAFTVDRDQWGAAFIPDRG